MCNNSTNFIEALFLTIQRLESKIDNLQNKLDALSPTGQATESEWLSIKGLQDYIPNHPSESTVRRLISSRTIPSFRSGKRVLVKKSDVDDWLKNSQRKSNQRNEDPTLSVVTTQKASKLPLWRQSANQKIPS